MNLGSDFQSFIRTLHSIGLPDHPFAIEAVSKSEGMKAFLQAEAYEPKSKTSALYAEFDRALQQRRHVDAKKLLDEIEVLFEDELSQRGDYFILEPLIVIALRALLIEALNHPHAYLIEPKKTSRHGNQMIAYEGFQVHIFKDENDRIKRLQFGFIDTTEAVERLLKKQTTAEFTKKQTTISTPTKPLQLSLVASSPKSLEHAQETTFEALDLSDLNLPDDVVSELNLINTERPGNHDFLTKAAELLFNYPDFFGTRGMGWFISKVRKRTYMNAVLGIEESIAQLELDIEKYIANREKFNTSVRKMNENSDETEVQSFQLRQFIDPANLENLEAETKYSFRFHEASHDLSISFSKSVVEFLKEPQNTGVQFIRAILRGPVSRQSVSGVVKLSSSSLDWVFEIRVLRKGAHHRPVVKVQPDGSWYVERVVDKLNK